MYALKFMVLQIKTLRGHYASRMRAPFYVGIMVVLLAVAQVSEHALLYDFMLYELLEELVTIIV